MDDALRNRGDAARLVLTGELVLTRFCECLATLSALVLSNRLKLLTELGLVNQYDVGTVPPHVIYSLTDDGRLLDALLVETERLSNEMRLPQSLNHLSSDTQDTP